MALIVSGRDARPRRNSREQASKKSARQLNAAISFRMRGSTRGGPRCAASKGAAPATLLLDMSVFCLARWRGAAPVEPLRQEYSNLRNKLSTGRLVRGKIKLRLVAAVLLDGCDGGLRAHPPLGAKETKVFCFFFSKKKCFLPCFPIRTTPGPRPPPRW